MSTLHDLLDRNLERPPEYRGGLSNHLPMVLHALHAMGAGDDRLRAFQASYVERFGPVPRATKGEPLQDWREARGRIDAFDALRMHFAATLDHDGLDATLRETLPHLWPGVGAAAFHGVIRTAHAVQSAHLPEVAAALAYWAARWMPVPEGNAASHRLAPENWARALEAAAVRTRCAGSLIAERMEAAVKSDDYRQLAEGPRDDEGASAADGPSAAQGPSAEEGPRTAAGHRIASPLLHVLADWGASVYARSGNFTVLHLVTGLRAVRVLQPWTGDGESAMRHVARAVTAAALASNVQLDAAEASSPQPSWDALRDAAIASDDDHVIKLVHACMEEREVYGEGPRRAAAQRAAFAL